MAVPDVDIINKLLAIAKEMLGSPAPDEPGSVVMSIEQCEPNGVIIKGLDPINEGAVFKTLNCDEVAELIDLAAALQELQGVG